MVNMIKVVIGLSAFLIGVAMFFFEQTRALGPFPLGFGLGLAGAGAQ